MKKPASGNIDGEIAVAQKARRLKNEVVKAESPDAGDSGFHDRDVDVGDDPANAFVMNMDMPGRSLLDDETDSS